MYQRVSVLVPTRGRIGRLETLLRSYEDTTAGCEGSSELVFRMDDDDPDTYDFLAARRHRAIVGPRLDGYGSMASFFNELAGFATGDVLMLGNDDMVFRSRGWAPAILAAADFYPDGIFDFGVATHNEAHYPFATVSKRAAEAMGHLWDPTIFWGDIYLRDVMAMFGRAVMLPDVHIWHDWAGHRPDQTFRDGQRRGNLSDVTERIPDYWTRVHPAAVERAYGKLKQLQERQP